MKSREISLLDMANGAIREELEIELQRVYENLIDENTPSNASRKITITLTFKAIDQKRKSFTVHTNTSSTLAKTNGVATSIVFEETDDGLVAIELGDQARGQLDLSGAELEEKVIPIRRAHD